MSFKDIKITGGHYCAASVEMIDKIIQIRDADAALLYLFMLRNTQGFSEDKAKSELGFDSVRLERAIFSLAHLNVVTTPAEKPIKTIQKQRYSTGELRTARNANMEFSAVCQTAEEKLGKVLTESMLRTLYVAYDELKLPAMVLIEMLSYLKSQKTDISRKDIEQEVYLWADMGIFEWGQATEYITRTQMLAPVKREMAIALKIDNRTLTGRENGYIMRFIDMGFDVATVELAYNRTYASIGKFSWNYINKILEDFHAKNLHTISEIDAAGLLFENKSTSQNSYNNNNKSEHKTNNPPQAGLSDWEKQWLDEMKKAKAGE